MNQEPKPLIEEHIIIVRPAQKPHIFDETAFDVIQATTKDGDKLIILRDKQ